MKIQNIKNIQKAGTVLTVAGAGFVVHHKVTSGKWYDKDQELCHGKVGLLFLSLGPVMLLASLLLWERAAPKNRCLAPSTV